MLKILNSWWFGYGSPVTIGLFRILMGALAFLNLAMVALYFDSWFTERGYVPQAIAHQYAAGVGRINLLESVTSTPLTIAFYAIVMIAAFLTTIGLWTRVSTIVLAVGVISLHHRNMLILHGGDTWMRVCLMYLAIAPAGAACSVDRLIALWKGKAPLQHLPVPLLGQRLVQFNLALLYLTTVWHKRGGTYWFDGTATWYPSNLHEFNRLWIPAGLEFNLWFVKLTTWGTLLTELALATLVFYRPFRKWVLLAGLAMHAFIEYRYNIPLFAFLTVSAYVCFYEGDEIQAWAKRLAKGFAPMRMRLFTPNGARLADGPASALEAADALGLVEVLPGEAPEWHAEDANGNAVHPVLETMKRLPLAFFAGPLIALAYGRRLMNAALSAGGRS